MLSNDALDVKSRSGTQDDAVGRSRCIVTRHIQEAVISQHRTPSVSEALGRHIAMKRDVASQLGAFPDDERRLPIGRCVAGVWMRMIVDAAAAIDAQP
jgi:hypothetical protein